VSEPFVIEASELRKQYDGVEALRGLNLHVPAGSIYGFLGRNGAGKTTTAKILLGMTRPTSGQVRVFGSPADVPRVSVDIRRRVGFVSDEKDLYDYMTVGEIIGFTRGFYPRWRPDLDASRASGALPATAPTWVPATIVIWIGAALIGKYVAWGLPSINSLVVGFLAYVVAGKLGLIRGVGTSRTMDSEPATATAVPATS